jgi:DNA-binding IclR family transcriptional regulator
MRLSGAQKGAADLTAGTMSCAVWSSQMHFVRGAQFHIHEKQRGSGGEKVQTSQVKSATRAIEILEYFKKVRQPRAMSEIALALGYPQSSSTVLLKTLVTLGYLNFDRRERLYFPTPKVTSLGDWVPRALFGTSRVLEAMHDVHASTGETVSIGTKNDVYLQYVQIIQSVHALRFHVDEGTLRPLTQSAVGWTLMSTLSDDKIDNIVRRANIATPKSSDRVKIPDMMERIREIRQKGYCSAENIPFLGGGTICVLLPISIQNQPVVLGLGGAAERIRVNHDRYLAILQRAVKAMRPDDPFEQPIDIEF